MPVAHTQIIIGIVWVGLMDSFLEEQVSRHGTSLCSVGMVAAVASSKSEVCNPVYIITGDGDEEITIALQLKLTSQATSVLLYASSSSRCNAYIFHALQILFRCNSHTFKIPV